MTDQQKQAIARIDALIPKIETGMRVATQVGSRIVARDLAAQISDLKAQREAILKNG
jgi:hypothetical protein